MDIFVKLYFFISSFCFFYLILSLVCVVSVGGGEGVREGNCGWGNGKKERKEGGEGMFVIRVLVSLIVWLLVVLKFWLVNYIIGRVGCYFMFLFGVVLRWLILIFYWKF